jgi:hypothetical protein
MSNHGQVGKALYLKFTVNKFFYKSIDGKEIKDGDILNIENSLIPIHIDNKTQGEYECVCEFGTEIH